MNTTQPPTFVAQAQSSQSGAVEQLEPNSGLAPVPGATGFVTHREILSHYEKIIEKSQAHVDQSDLALFRIHKLKLYKLTHNTWGEYIKERWGLSRSRAYQMLHHAHLLLDCMQKGKPPPANERQSRRLAADGTPLKNQPENSSYQNRLEG